MSVPAGHRALTAVSKFSRAAQGFSGPQTLRNGLRRGSSMMARARRSSPIRVPRCTICRRA
jgi:hypothetical protein